LLEGQLPARLKVAKFTPATPGSKHFTDLPARPQNIVTIVRGVNLRVLTRANLQAWDFDSPGVKFYDKFSKKWHRAMRYGNQQATG
jgi:hypothetical protein